MGKRPRPPAFARGPAPEPFAQDLTGVDSLLAGRQLDIEEGPFTARPMRHAPAVAVRRSPSITVALTLVAIVALLLVPGALAGAAVAAGAPTGNCAGATATNGIVAVVTWNGIDTCTARSPSTALSVDLSATAQVNFTWSGPPGSSTDLTDARLAMNYLGFALATRDVGPIVRTPVPGGSFAMDWNPGVLTYVVAGMYSLTASLFASNGSLVWAETFYVKATAPYLVLALFPIALLVIGAYELYHVARTGRRTRATRPDAPPPNDGPAPSGTAGESSAPTGPPEEGSP